MTHSFDISLQYFTGLSYVYHVALSGGLFLSDLVVAFSGFFWGQLYSFGGEAPVAEVRRTTLI